MTSVSTSRDSRVHVVHVIGSLQIGGAEKMLVNFVKAVDKEKFRHTIMCLTDSGEMAGDAELEDINLVVHKVRFRRVIKDLRSLTRWFRMNDVSVVHSHMFGASMWARIAGLLADVPVLITTEHSQEHWKKWWQIKLDHFLSKKTFHHIAVSEDVRQIRIKRDGVAPDRITMIPNGVPVPEDVGVPEVRRKVRAEFGLDETTPVIGTVGRMIEVKGYPLLLEALVLARRSIPELHWLQIGDGPDREKIMELAENLGLSSSISFAGRRSDVGALLETMDIWVMCSTHEGLPVSLLEAMAAGKPIVATEVGGIPDVVDDGASALLVSPWNAEELAGGIIRILKDGSLAENLGASARDRVCRDFGIEAVSHRIESIYLQGLSEGRE